MAEERVRQEFRIKEGCTASTGDFWYDLTAGGYLRPEEILERPEDVKKVQEAIDILTDFQASCENQIEDFTQ